MGLGDTIGIILILIIVAVVWFFWATIQCFLNPAKCAQQTLGKTVTGFLRNPFGLFGGGAVVGPHIKPSDVQKTGETVVKKIGGIF